MLSHKSTAIVAANDANQLIAALHETLQHSSPIRCQGHQEALHHLAKIFQEANNELLNDNKSQMLQTYSISVSNDPKAIKHATLAHHFEQTPS